MKGSNGPSFSGAGKRGENAETATVRRLTELVSTELFNVDSRLVYPKGTILFMERQPARGIFVVRRGQVKLSISSSEGKRLIVRIAQPNDVLGLTAALAGRAYETTAETIHACEASFVRRDDLLRIMTKYPEAAQLVAGEIIAQYEAICEELRTVGLFSSVRQRLARLLLAWSKSEQESPDSAPIVLALTHEEIAECIGSTRETVTRAFTDFRQRRLVEVHGATVKIPNRAALENLACV